MKSFLLLFAFALPAMAANTPKVDELAMAQAEAKAYREAWLDLKRRDELLGISSLSHEARDSHDKVARLAGELIRSEKARQDVFAKAKAAVEAAVKWAAETDAGKRAAARSDFESAKRTLEATMQKTAEPRAMASGLTDAQIVAVDRDQQAVVLNLGSLQGAKEGMPFRILRKDQVIGSCRLIEVREMTSAGLPEQLGKGIQLEVGDRVAVLAEK
ncbi:MAG: hypothetical protein EBZ53_06675 [Verrucomicrobia bacterium]|nr:hypothetical protein [Verrucomicrobiota bacterium]NDA25334.1 hypothetical protein [Verrucomicrobiota bacterium]NDD82226.1 hypothetical protein [Verrucomicrobiota bacterium]